MQTNRKRTPHVQSLQSKAVRSRYEPEHPSQPIALLAAFCLLLPPLGVALTWRSSRVSMPLRAALSGLGLAAMTLIFFLLMRPEQTAPDIRPLPAVPVQDGFGVVAAQETLPPLVADAPAQPDLYAQQGTAEMPQPTEESGELTLDSIVYAVTNNASSYHLDQTCGMQENHRALTLQQALDEGLNPCEVCVGAVG